MTASESREFGQDALLPHERRGGREVCGVHEANHLSAGVDRARDARTSPKVSEVGDRRILCGRRTRIEQRAGEYADEHFAWESSQHRDLLRPTGSRPLTLIRIIPALRCPTSRHLSATGGTPIQLAVPPRRANVPMAIRLRAFPPQGTARF